MKDLLILIKIVYLNLYI